jgi:hypothetical protein
VRDVLTVLCDAAQETHRAEELGLAAPGLQVECQSILVFRDDEQQVVRNPAHISLVSGAGVSGCEL